jgi:hypothetical protein
VPANFLERLLWRLGSQERGGGGHNCAARRLRRRKLISIYIYERVNLYNNMCMRATTIISPLAPASLINRPSKDRVSSAIDCNFFILLYFERRRRRTKIVRAKHWERERSEREIIDIIVQFYCHDCAIVYVHAAASCFGFS